jgi:hypothetical protein
MIVIAWRCGRLYSRNTAYTKCIKQWTVTKIVKCNRSCQLPNVCISLSCLIYWYITVAERCAGRNLRRKLMEHSYERKFIYRFKQFPYEFVLQCFLHLGHCVGESAVLKLHRISFVECNWIFIHEAEHFRGSSEFVLWMKNMVFCLVWVLNQQSMGFMISEVNLRSIRWLKWSTSMI